MSFGHYIIQSFTKLAQLMRKYKLIILLIYRIINISLNNIFFNKINLTDYRCNESRWISDGNNVDIQVQFGL